MIASAKPSVDEQSIRYQALTKITGLAEDIASVRNLNSSNQKILQATKIRLWLKALDYKNYLSREQREKIWYALIDISGIYDFPVAPVLANVNRPDILIGGGGGGAGSVNEWGDIGGVLSNQTDLQAALDAKVDISGDTMTGNLGFTGAGINPTDYIQFNTVPTSYTPAIGNIGWNDVEGTIDLLLRGGVVNLPLGQKQVARIVNGTGGNVLKSNYQVVKVIGAQGQRLQVALAQGNNDANSADTLGLIAENINNNNTGFIVTSGLVENINTTGSLQGETWADGNILYLSPTVAGRITNIKPQAPQHSVIVGFVVYAHANNGKIFVKVDNGYEIDELHNVRITTPTNGQVLKYNSTLSVWENNTVSDGHTIQDAGVNETQRTNLNFQRMLVTDDAGNNATVVTRPSDTFIGITAPANPVEGDEWTNSETWSTYKYYDGFWVEISNINPSAVAGTGTTNYLPKFTGASTIGNSLVYDNGTSVGIGTASPSYKFQVSGTSGTVGISASSNTADDILFYGVGTVTGNINLLTTNINATSTSLLVNRNYNSATGNAQIEANVPSTSTGDPYFLLTTSGATNWSLGIDNSASDIFKIGPNANPSSGSASLSITTGGNTLIGTTIDSGFKLDVNGTVRITDDITLNKVNQRLIFSNTISQGGLMSSGTNTLRISGGGSGSSTNYTSIALVCLGDISAGNISATSGTINIVQIAGNSFGNQLAMSSGNLTYNALLVTPGINTTGTYSGIVRGIYYNPLITSATGVTHRAIETTTGNVVFNSTSGNTLIGTTTDSGFKLDVNGTFRQSGSTTAASGLAVGSTITPTLTAAANSDVLVGLDINPTFTNGAFTGVSNLALRVNGSQQISGTNALRILASDGNTNKGGWIYSGSLGGGMLVLSTNIDENNTVPNAGNYSTRLQMYSANARLEFLTSVSVGSTSLPASFVVSNVWTATSSERAGILYNGYFQPTSGTANISAISMQPVINMTGTYSGVVRGYYYNPTLTSLTGVTHVGFENTTGVNRFNTTSGNTLIGTTTDSGFKLDVNGLVNFTGTTASDGGQLGAELLSAAGWTSTGWTGSFGAGWTHTVGNTTALTNTLAAVNGNYYYISWVVTGRTAGTFVIAYGGFTSGSISSTGNIGPRATSAGTLSITPTTDFDGTIVISIKQITAGSASVTLKNSSGTVTNELSSIRNDNLFIGTNSGKFVASSATDNYAFGRGALYQVTTGTQNVAIGRDALASVTWGYQNTAIGYRAANAGISINNAVAIGFDSAYNNTNGAYVSIGHYAARSSTTGIFWASIGRSAGFSNQTGSSWTAIGDVSGYSNTTGGSWTSIGQASGYNNGTGSNWVAIGQEAARYYAGGTSSATSFSNGVYLGTTTKVGVAGAANEIVIGYQAEGLGSNTTVLGNSSTTYGRWFGNLLVGSSTNSGEALQITGLASFTGTTASDGGQLGAELLSASGWTSTDWTGSFATGWTHTTGNTTALTNTLAAVNGTYYQITYTVTGRTAGTFVIAFGGYTSGSLSATGNVGPRATSTGTLSITPTTDFDGTIVISIKVITAGSATLTIKNSSGTVINEINGSPSNENTFIGIYAGEYITTGLYNTALGTGALAKVTSSQNNIGIGRNALASVTTSSSNVAIGFQSQVLSNGGSNVSVGAYTMQGNTTGTDNTAVGYYSLQANTTGIQNASFGGYSLSYITSGSNNVAIGRSAGRGISTSTNLTVANNSVFIGYDTRANADSETNQLVVGYAAIGLGSNTTVIGNSSTTYGRWWGNLLVGTSTNAGYALDVNGTARIQSDAIINTINIGLGGGSNQYNARFGVNALTSNTTGQTNNAFGWGALYTNTTGSDNVAIGHRPLYNNLSARYNVAIGTSALFYNSTGENNTAVGYWSLLNNNASNNTAFGSYSLYQNVSGSANTAIGFEALHSNGPISGSNNVGIGYQASRYDSGNNACQQLSNSVIIGYDARPNASADSNEIVIGYTGRGNGSNTITIGNSSITNNYIFGNFNISDAKNIILGTTTGTKIGTANTQKLSFWNAAPVSQPTTGVSAATLVGGGGTTLTDTDTFDGYTLAQIVKALRNTGILA